MAKGNQINLRPAPPLLAAIDQRIQEIRASTGVTVERTKIVEAALRAFLGVTDDDDEQPTSKAKPAKKGARK